MHATSSSLLLCKSILAMAAAAGGSLMDDWHGAEITCYRSINTSNQAKNWQKVQNQLITEMWSRLMHFSRFWCMLQCSRSSAQFLSQIQKVHFRFCLMCTGIKKKRPKPWGLEVFSDSKTKDWFSDLHTWLAFKSGLPRISLRAVKDQILLCCTYLQDENNNAPCNATVFWWSVAEKCCLNHKCIKICGEKSVPGKRQELLPKSWQTKNLKNCNIYKVCTRGYFCWHFVIHKVDIKMCPKALLVFPPSHLFLANTCPIY